MIMEAPILDHIERPDFGRSYCHPAESIPEKINRCDAHGECTCGFYPDAENCLYLTKTEVLNDVFGCILHAYNYQCMSLAARKDAKQNKVISTTTSVISTTTPVISTEGRNLEYEEEGNTHDHPAGSGNRPTDKTQPGTGIGAPQSA